MTKNNKERPDQRPALCLYCGRMTPIYPAREFCTFCGNQLVPKERRYSERRKDWENEEIEE